MDRPFRHITMRVPTGYTFPPAGTGTHGTGPSHFATLLPINSILRLDDIVPRRRAWVLMAARKFVGTYRLHRTDEWLATVIAASLTRFSYFHSMVNVPPSDNCITLSDLFWLRNLAPIAQFAQSVKRRSWAYTNISRTTHNVWDPRIRPN